MLPNFVSMIMQSDEKGLPHVANDQQFHQINKLFNLYYNIKEPNLEQIQAERKSIGENTKIKLDREDSDSSIFQSEILEDDDYMKLSKDFSNSTNARFEVYCKYLNILLLKTGDPFVAKKYENYLKQKKDTNKHEKDFFKRMEIDVQSRALASQESLLIKRQDSAYSLGSKMSKGTSRTNLNLESEKTVQNEKKFKLQKELSLFNTVLKMSKNHLSQKREKLLSKDPVDRKIFETERQIYQQIVPKQMKILNDHRLQGEVTIFEPKLTQRFSLKQ